MICLVWKLSHEAVAEIVTLLCCFSFGLVLLPNPLHPLLPFSHGIWYGFVLCAQCCLSVGTLRSCGAPLSAYVCLYTCVCVFVRACRLFWRSWLGTFQRQTKRVGEALFYFMFFVFSFSRVVMVGRSSSVQSFSLLSSRLLFTWLYPLFWFVFVLFGPSVIDPFFPPVCSLPVQAATQVIPRTPLPIPYSITSPYCRVFSLLSLIYRHWSNSREL